MRVNVPCRHISELAELFDEVGEPARIVGGAVRDVVAGSLFGGDLKIKDVDLATPALPGDVMAAAERLGHRVVPTGLKHGTVTVVVEHEPYEITTLRADVATDGRHAEVAFVRDFETDAARRDFTFNAMSADFDGTLHDYFGGASDLAARRVAFVGDLDDRVEEDYLRMLRFFRFRARYGGNENESYLGRMSRHVAGLERISGERIWSEMSRILSGPAATMQIADMESLGILDAFGLRLDRDRNWAALLGGAAPLSSNPAALLGLVADSPATLDAVVDRLKPSLAERKAAALALEVKLAALSDEGDPLDAARDPHPWACRIAEGWDEALLRPLLKALRLGPVEALIPSPMPSFPLLGRDLVAVGMSPGPALGVRLAELRARWMDSGFSLDKHDLIDLFERDLAGDGGAPGARP
jgi:tRNA nucleotidyltransferase/poly(A) polymerase